MKGFPLILLFGAVLTGASNAAPSDAVAPTSRLPALPAMRARHQKRRQRQASSDSTLGQPAVPTSSAPSFATSAACVGTRGGAAASSGMRHTLKVLFLFAGWYALNVQYNMVNKKVLNVLPLPWLVAVAQLGVGVLYCSLIWIMRVRPFPLKTIRGAGLRAVVPIGLCHGLGQCATVLSLCAGAVSFTHIVKALEPFFSAIVSAVASGVILAPRVYATLVPVVAGVSVAVAKELSFSWLSFGTAMFSNLAFAMRAVYSKLAMGNASVGLSAPNLYGTVTIIAFLAMAPVALFAEGSKMRDVWSTAVTSLDSSDLAWKVALSGLYHYLNNEVMYLVLGEVHPITLAVGNTLKRTVLIVASLIVFRHPITPTAAVGSAVAMVGVLVYSLTKAHYDKLAAAESGAASRA